MFCQGLAQLSHPRRRCRKATDTDLVEALIKKSLQSFENIHHKGDSGTNERHKLLEFVVSLSNHERHQLKQSFLKFRMAGVLYWLTHNAKLLDQFSVLPVST